MGEHIDSGPDVRRASPAAPTEFLIGEARERCVECWGCVRYCPARAMRVADDRSEVIPEKCVKCGLCVSECGNCGHLVRDDTGRVRALLEGGRPVVALLASEFVAAMHPMTVPEVERALESVGFYAVESTVLGEELVATAYEQALARPSHLPRLRSTCPVVVAWVCKFYPQLAGALVPLVPPYVAQARLVRAVYPEDVAIVYVSPCYARKDEIFDPELAGAVDVSIDFFELKRLLESLPQVRPFDPDVPAGARRPQPVKEISLTDGFPRRTLQDRKMTDSDVSVVRGLRELDDLLQAMVRGESAPSVIDMLNCEGCIDGPTVNPGLSVFAKRNVEAAERRRQVVSVVGSRALLAHLPSVELRRAFAPDPVRLARPSEAEIDAVLAEGEFLSREETPDCGACGYATCVEHAIAIISGDSTWEMCFPLQRKLFRRDSERLEACATIDEVTGLWNRRVFSERLAEEVARSSRYGTPVSLVMLDLDRFKDVNDRYGHVAGDVLLAAVGTMLRSSLRETDVPARYGGDEFAIILPGITKTEAFVVAEKLRTNLAASPVRLGEGPDAADVTITGSFGVAAPAPTIADDVALLEAADSALYVAKDAGRDQVRIAAG